MRRMVGAAMVVGGLATVTVLGWLRQATRSDVVTLPIIETPAEAEMPASSPDSIFPTSPAAITTLSNPLAFLSTAGADSLDLLPGVGPVLAARLISARAEHGAFRSWDDVDRVRGIGPKTLERLQALASH